MFNKFKQFFEDDTFFYGMCVLLVGLSSFGLGRHSATEKPLISSALEGNVVLSAQRESLQDTVETIPNSAKDETLYVGSKNGTKYHLISCPGADQIKEENKVFFDTPQEARSMGYSPAGNCPGIE